MIQILLFVVTIVLWIADSAKGDNALDCLAAHNKIRQASGLPPLKLDKRLCAAAAKHAEYMAGGCKLDHRGPGDEMYADRALAAGYNTDSANASENIAEGPVEFMDAAFTTKAWLQSKVGHKENVLSKSWRHVGFGVARGKDDRLYWCAVYAAPELSQRASPLPVIFGSAAASRLPGSATSSSVPVIFGYGTTFIQTR